MMKDTVHQIRPAAESEKRNDDMLLGVETMHELCKYSGRP